MAYQKIYMNQIHSSSLLCQLSQMWQRDILCDAVIYAGTTAVKVHRVVLVAACPMLQSMDGSDAGNKLEVKLSQDIKLESITEFLRYLYDGFMMLTEDNVKDIEKIGRLLQVDSVTKCCADFFKVLQTQAGQNTSYNPQFSFHADQAEFRHVRASDLLRSMQNGIEKRSSEGDIASSRKKAKKSNEDMFEVMQVDTGKGNAGSRVCQSLAVSVASRSEPSETSVQVIDAAQGVKSKQPVVLESKTSTNKSQDERNIGRPMVSLLSGAKAAKSLNLTPSSANSEQPFTQLSKAKKSSQRSSTKTRPDDKDTDEQILIKPIGDEGIFMAEALTTEPSSLTSPVEFDTELNGEDPDRGAATVSLEDTGQADSKQLSAAGLSVVKIEKLNTDDSTYMGQFEDYCYAEDDGSDTEAVYDDEAGLGTSDGPTWYIQTFKEHLIKNDEDPAFEEYTDFDLDNALVRFYKATNLPPEELRKFPIRLSQYLNESPYYRNINIRRNTEFEDSNTVMQQVMYGSFQAEDFRRKRPMLQEDLNKLYDSGVLSNDNPTSLQNKVWVELMIYIGGLSRQDLRNLEKDNFIFEKDENGTLFYHIDSNSIPHEKKKIRVFEQPENLNCPVQSLWLYLSKLNPSSPVFFQQPFKENIGADDPVWYSQRPIGKNAHSQWLGTICKEAGVTTEYRNQALYCRNTTPIKDSKKAVPTQKK